MSKMDIAKVKKDLHAKKRKLGAMYYRGVPIDLFTKTELLMMLFDSFEKRNSSDMGVVMKNE